MKKENGITLIALVVTIIILLILAGVSIASLTGDSGLLNQANYAKKMTEVGSEKEAIELSVVAEKMENKGNYKIGKKLFDKTLQNGNKWRIISISDSNQIYGTGWNYIPKNTNVKNYGTIKNNWIVNYETSELIPLEVNTYTELSYESGLAVTDGLVFNADPKNMSDSNSWGNGVKLLGFDEEGETGGWTENAIKFDGVNDYITIDGNLDVQDEITLEIYGKINGYSDERYNYIPMFSAFSNSKASDVEGLGMRGFFKLGYLTTNFGYGNCGNGNLWENENAKHNLQVHSPIDLNTDFMFTCTYNHSTNLYTVYRDGKIVKQEKIDPGYWDNFKMNEIPNIEYFQIGKVRWNSITAFFNGEIYSIRIYNKSLKEEQVLENYNKTILYHTITSPDNK